MIANASVVTLMENRVWPRIVNATPPESVESPTEVFQANAQLVFLNSVSGAMVFTKDQRINGIITGLSVFRSMVK
jgi:hypothetical protein